MPPAPGQAFCRRHQQHRRRLTFRPLWVCDACEREQAELEERAWRQQLAEALAARLGGRPVR